VISFAFQVRMISKPDELAEVWPATFPPRLGIPPTRRDSHFPTAPATAAHPPPLKLNGQTW
jgi:hypothetical protein